MRITGRGIWGPPADPATAVKVLRRAVELGVDFIDTADSYGPYVSEDLIREALHPYRRRRGLRPRAASPARDLTSGRSSAGPEYLRQCVEMSLRRLDVEQIDLYQLHRIDGAVPLEDQLGELRDLQEEGKIRHLGLSEVTVEELEAARAIVPIVERAEPLQPLQPAVGGPPRPRRARRHRASSRGSPSPTGRLARPAARWTPSPSARGPRPPSWPSPGCSGARPSMLPIPGTGSVKHLEENVAAAEIVLDDGVYAELSALAGGA